MKHTKYKARKANHFKRIMKLVKLCKKYDAKRPPAFHDGEELTSLFADLQFAYTVPSNHIDAFIEIYNQLYQRLGSGKK